MTLLLCNDKNPIYAWLFGQVNDYGKHSFIIFELKSQR